MDEPSAILDDEVETLFGVVRRLREEGVGIIYISHRLDEIPRIGDRVTVLSDGRTVATSLPADTQQQTLVEHMVGRKVEQLFQRAAATGDVVLSVRGVSGAPMVKENSFEVREGEVVGIGGLVGAGRTELLRLVYGLDKPDTGEVHMNGKRLPAGKPAAAIAAGLGLAPEDRKSQGLLLDWTLTKNVTLADLGRFGRGPWSTAAASAPPPWSSCALKTVPDDGDRITRELSGDGNRRSSSRAGCCASARCTLLDEPTRGVDVGAKAEIYKVIADLAREGLSIVVVSSELSELAGLCTRVLVVREGQLVKQVAGDEATKLELRNCRRTHRHGTRSPGRRSDEHPGRRR